MWVTAVLSYRNRITEIKLKIRTLLCVITLLFSSVWFQYLAHGKQNSETIPMNVWPIGLTQLYIAKRSTTSPYFVITIPLMHTV